MYMYLIYSLYYTTVFVHNDFCIYICLCEAPTVLCDVRDSDPIMQQEVFGPVLPILTVNSIDEAISFISRREKPLCVYAYSSNSKVTGTSLHTQFMCTHTIYAGCHASFCFPCR